MIVNIMLLDYIKHDYKFYDYKFPKKLNILWSELKYLGGLDRI